MSPSDRCADVHWDAVTPPCFGVTWGNCKVTAGERCLPPRGEVPSGRRTLAVRLAGLALRAQGQQWPQASRMKRGQGVPSQWEAVLLHLGGEDETGRSPRGTG